MMFIIIFLPILCNLNELNLDSFYHMSYLRQIRVALSEGYIVIFLILSPIKDIFLSNIRLMEPSINIIMIIMILIIMIPVIPKEYLTKCYLLLDYVPLFFSICFFSIWLPTSIYKIE